MLSFQRIAVPIVALSVAILGLPAVAATPTTYEKHRDQVILSHYEHPSPAMTGCTDARGFVNYATAALWLQRSIADANNKLAAVRIGHITGQACDQSIDPSRANLWLSTMLRPYFLFKANSLYFPGRLTAAAADNLVAQMWAYAAPYSKRSEAADPWSIYDSENHDAQAESFNLLAAQAFKNRNDYKFRTYADGSTPAQQYQAWHAHWSNYFDEVAKRGLFIEVGSPIYHGYLVDAILNVYNFAEMTRDEVRDLLARTEGRVCARLYRRADGTVLTRDCPTGLRALRRRGIRRRLLLWILRRRRRHRLLRRNRSGPAHHRHEQCRGQA